MSPSIVEDAPPPHTATARPTEEQPAVAEQVPLPRAEEAPSASPASSPPQVVVKGAPGQGLTVTVGDAFSMNVKVRVQVRYQIVDSAPDDTDHRNVVQLAQLGTLRVGFSGNILSPELKYFVQLALAAKDYRDGAISPVYDAYVDYVRWRDLNVRVGQYFVPFDRLRTVREFALQMTERPRPVAELTLDRDVGVTVYSEHFLGDRSPVAFRLGAFGGGGMNLTQGHEPGGLFVGRLELRPLGAIDDDQEGDLERRKAPALALGAAMATNINTNRARSTTGTTFVGGTADYLHAAADLVFKWRGWAVEAEYLWRHAKQNQIQSTDADGNDVVEWTRSAQGWILQTSYAFDPPVEIVARLSRMYALNDTDPKLVAEIDDFGQEVGAGLNYYLNGHRMKLQADWIARMPGDFAFARAEHAVHAQLDVTF